MREAEEEYRDAGFELQVITYIVYTYISILGVMTTKYQ